MAYSNNNMRYCVNYVPTYPSYIILLVVINKIVNTLHSAIIIINTLRNTMRRCERLYSVVATKLIHCSTVRCKRKVKLTKEQ